MSDGTLPDPPAAAPPDATRTTWEPRPEFLRRLEQRFAAAPAPGWRLLESGQKLARFELLELVGRGAFGAVYRARDPELDRAVAVKVPRAGSLLDRDDQERFLREARSAAQLRHPGIVTVYEAGQADGVPYLACQFVRGLTLADLLPDRRPGFTEAARLIAAVADALEYAHGQGVVHRDIKPSNIMLGPDGAPLVMDFGLAKRDAGDVTVTLDGQVLGTPAYMSPEQARGESRQVDGRSDVYSLGVVLYQLLVGELPFRGTARLLLHHVLHDEPRPPRQLNEAVPRDLETICLKAMAKESGRRYQTAGELADDLRRFLKGEPIRARPTASWERGWRWCRRNPVVAGLAASLVLALVTLAGGSLVTALWLGKERDLATENWQRAEGAEAALREEHETTLANLRRAEVAEQDGREKLWKTYLAQARASRWSGRQGRRFDGLDALAKAAEIARSLKLGPAQLLELRNEAIACLALSDLRVDKAWPGFPPGAKMVTFDARLERFARSDVQGNVSVRRVADDQEILRFGGLGRDPGFLLFSPDGRYLAARNDSAPLELRVWDLNTREVALNPPHGAFAFTPDGRGAAVSQPDTSIALFDLASRKEVKRLERGPPPHFMAFHPDGRRLAVSSKTPIVRVLDIDTGAVLAELAHPHPVREIAWSDDGRLLATACADFHVHVWQAGTLREEVVLKGHTSEVTEVVFNHGSDLLGSTGWDGTVFLWDPWGRKPPVQSARGGAQGGAWDGFPRYQFGSDDGRLGFVWNSPEIGLWEVAPGRECRWIVVHEGYKGPHMVGFSPDGRLMASAGHDGVRLLDCAAFTEVAFLPLGNTHVVAFAPDGHHLITWGDSGLQRWPVAPAGAEQCVGPPEDLGKLVPPGPAGPTPDGRAFIVLHADQVRIVDPADPSKTLTFPCGSRVEEAAISPDGHWLATATAETNRTSKTLRLWDVHAKQSARDLPVEDDPGFEFSPDGRWLVTRTATECRCWQVGSWEPHWVVQSPESVHHQDRVPAFTRDGHMVAVAASANRVQLLRCSDGQELASLEVPPMLTHLCFSSDASRLAAAFETHLILIWDLRAIRSQLAAIGLDWEPAAARR